MDFFRRKKRNDDDLFGNFFNDDFEKIFNNMFKDIQEQMAELHKNMEEMENQPGVQKRTYGFTMKIGPDGHVKIEEFGNIPAKKAPKKSKHPLRQPLVDVMDRDKEVAVIAELPGVSKKDIKLKLSKDKKTFTIKAGDKYYKELKLPSKVKKIEKQTYKNGVLDVTLKK